MRIALIGYGKMGKAIEEMALERGHEIVAKIDRNYDWASFSSMDADVAIEFTRPDAAAHNISMCLDQKIPVVIGTTGWYDSFEKIKAKVAEQNCAILPATNFSIGVNIFLEINSLLARLMNQQTNYEVKIEETHHTQKLDAPSGTAITIAEDILQQLDRKKNWVHNTPVMPSDLEIIDYRKPNVPGTHSVKYQSEIDTLEIKHEAHNRKGFALGAVIAAEFLQDKIGVYTMKDVLNLN